MATEVAADSLGEEWKVRSVEGCVRAVFGEFKLQNFSVCSCHTRVFIWCMFGRYAESFSSYIY